MDLLRGKELEQRVDVVVPCYKYGHFLQECVQSVLSQTNVDLRILILDDASPDDTPAIGTALASQDKRVTFRRHDSNRGHIATYNEGIEWASGDFLLILSADDYLVPGALRRASQLMSDHPDVGFTFGNVLNLQTDGSIERGCPLGMNRAMPDQQVLPGSKFIRISGATNIVPTPTAIVRTNLQKQLGGYQADLPHTGDMEMWLRLASHSAVGYINADQAVYRWHSSNMSHQYVVEHSLPDLRQRKMALEMLDSKGGVYFKNDPEIRQFLFDDLAREALAHAGRAFNNFDLATAKAIQSFASELAPGVRKSLPWAKLAFKQTIGPKYWCALNSLRRKL